MADESGRTPAEREAARLEREAARLERERRRAPRTGRKSEPPPATESAPGSQARAEPAQVRPEPAPVRAEPAAVTPEPARVTPEPALVGPEAGPLGRPGTAPGDPPDGGHARGDRPGAGPGPGDPPEDEALAEELYQYDDREAPSGTRRVSRRDKPGLRPGKPMPARRRRPPAHEQRRHSWAGRIAALLALAVAGVVIWFLVELFQPFHGSAHGSITVEIPQHSSSSRIGDLLARDGVISSSFFFELRATLAGERGALRPGVYRLQLGMSYGAVLSALTKPPSAAKVTDLTITEGQRRQQISLLLREQHVSGSYLAATRSSKLLDWRAYGLRHAPPSLEGFLFPDTYQLAQPISIPTLVADQLTTFKREFAKVNLGYARSRRLTPYEVLTIASLIEAETPTVHDRPLVASVIYNRLANGMTLGLDSTTQYATGNFTRPLTVSQLQSPSPYNTRTHVGLPPTPIGNPGLASMQAAAHPAQTNYLFFLARPCQSGSAFASDYAQFLALNARYQARRC